MPFPPPYPILIHTFPSPPECSSLTSTLQLHQHLPNLSSSSSSSSSPNPVVNNALLFIGGLGDGPSTIPYVRSLATSASFPSLRYSIFEARLSSSYSAFGYSSLSQDAKEIQECIRYLGRTVGVKKVVLMGHSTGCQDALEYVLKRNSWSTDHHQQQQKQDETKVAGVILQGPVSDREAIGMSCDAREVEESLKVARGLIGQGKGDDIMPKENMPEGWRGSPVTAYRWVSLAGVGGDDDYFSSDLDDEKLKSIWGKLEQPVLILPSAKDEWVPQSVDMAGLVEKWKSFCPPGIASELSGLIPGANHRVEGNEEEGERWLVERVSRFLEGI